MIVRRTEPDDYGALHRVLDGPLVLAGTLQIPFPSLFSMFGLRPRSLVEGRGYNLLVARDSDRGGACGLCGRIVERRTRHHLIPRSRHANKRVKKAFSRDELQRTVPLCTACHRQIHRTLTEKELERDYNTVEALLSHPDISRFVRWIEGKPHGVVARRDAAL